MNMAVIIFLLLGFGDYEPKEGDLVFQSSLSSQSRAIELATGSRYSHVGVVFLNKGAPYVFEALSTVRLTPLKKWIARGREQNYVVMRMKRPLSSSEAASLRRYGTLLKGRRYDSRFLWSDHELYCSELVWKLFNGAGVILAKPKTMRDYNFENPLVGKLLNRRWGNHINWDEVVVAPSDLYASSLLAVAYRSKGTSP